MRPLEGTTTIPTTFGTVSAALKEDYRPAIREELNNKVKFLAQIEKNTEDVEGLEAYLALHVRRNNGVGARAEYGTLPGAGNQGYAAEKVPLVQNYGRMAISGPIIEAMASNRGSFDRAVKSETSRLVNDLKRDVNRQIFGTSDGVIAKVQATANTTPTNLATATTAVQFRQLEPGMLIDCGPIASNPAGSFTQLEILATAGSAGAYTITFTTPGGSVAVNVTTGNNDSISRSGAGGGVAGGTGVTAKKEVTGLQTIVASSGALFNVDPATQPVWKSTVDSAAANRSVSEQMVAKAQQGVDIASGGTVNQIWCSDGVQRAYANLLTTLKRFNNTVEIKGGFTGIDVSAGAGGTCTLVYDRDAPGNKMFGLDTTHLIEFYATDWDWMDMDGSVLSRVPNVDAYEATLRKYSEFATDARNAHFLISEITEA